MDPDLLLTRSHQFRDQPAKVVSLSLKLLASLGFVITGGQAADVQGTPLVVVQWGLTVDAVVETWLHLCMAYASVAPRLCEATERYARTAYSIVVGEDETFDESYGRKLEARVCL